MRNKGFTLIELLAVIVILAIIALIATPIVLGIINDSRKSADRETAKLMVSNFELAYNTAYMQNQGKMPTLEDVYKKFNMENIDNSTENTYYNNGELKITSKSGNVVCTATAPTEESLITFECKIGNDVISSSKATVAKAS